MSRRFPEFEEFDKHREECQQCKFFPISPACYQGARILNPKLGTEKEYWEQQYLWKHKFTEYACDTCGEKSNQICDCGRWVCEKCREEEHPFCYPGEC